MIDGPGPGRLPFAPEGGFRRGGERDREPGPQAELFQLIRELRTEVEQLRREVRELKEAQGDRPAVPRLREGERREGDPPRIRREDRRIIRRLEGERRDGEARDRERPEGEARERERDGERRETEARERERDGERRETEAAERETDEGRERLEKAREERDREVEGGEVSKAVKPSTPEALFVFAALDENKNNQIDHDEWAASKSTREAFENQKITVSLPVNSRAFLALYTDQRLFPQLRLPGE